MESTTSLINNDFHSAIAKTHAPVKSSTPVFILCDRCYCCTTYFSNTRTPYGPERHYMYNALRIAWQDYYNLSKEQVLDKKIINHNKHVIHTLQDNLRMAPTAFRQLEVIGPCFHELNPELFKEDVTYDMIDKGMIKKLQF
jgi:hypothetical protein